MKRPNAISVNRKMDFPDQIIIFYLLQIVKMDF